MHPSPVAVIAYLNYKYVHKTTCMHHQGKGSFRTYFLVTRDGFDKPYPSYDELAKDDVPPPQKLPVTKGRVFRLVTS